MRSTQECLNRQRDLSVFSQLFVCSVGVLYRHNRLTVNGVVTYFVKKGDSNLRQREEQKQEAVQQRHKCPVLFMHVYCVTFPTKCGSHQSGHPQLIFVHRIMSGRSSFDSRQKPEFSLLQTIQTTSVDPLSCLSTARPTAEYFPVAKAAGTQSCQHSPAKMLKIITAIPPISLHGPQINNCHTN